METYIPSLQDVTSYYHSKTKSILKRYGPGPRVHYHTGLMDNSPLPGLSRLDLRRRLVAAQERLLYCAVDAWDASPTLTGEVLDVGCGFGGGAIFWAEQFGAHVTANTCVASHVDLVVRFAAQAGVASRIRPLLCDALAVPGEDRFDAAVAIDSSCHLERRKWFVRLASLLRAKGHVLIADCFLGRPEYETAFNSYWHTRIGTIPEYFDFAEQADFQVDSVHDISQRTKHFWATTKELIEAEIREKSPAPDGGVRCHSSIRAHALMQQALADGGLQYCLMRLSKK